MKRRKSLETVAYHEAGHAVMGVITRRRLSIVSIMPDDRTRGHVRFKKLGEKLRDDIEHCDEFDLRTRARVEALIMVDYAGSAAASILRRRNVNRGARADFDSAAMKLDDLSCG